MIYTFIDPLYICYPKWTGPSRPNNWTASGVITGHLVAALRGQVELRTADNSTCLWEGQTEVWRRSTQKSEEALTTKIAGALIQGAHQLRRETKTGSWMTVHLSMLNGTYLEAQEWIDDLFLQFGLEPPDLPKYCDSCNAELTIFRALNCKRGVLVTARHNELRDGVADLAGKAVTPYHMRDDTLIFAGCAVKRPKSPGRQVAATLL